MTRFLRRISVAEICECEAVERSLVAEIVHHEIARPLAGDCEADWEFDITSAHWMRRAIRLRRDLDIDWVAVAALVDLLRERDALREENRNLRQRLERFHSGD